VIWVSPSVRKAISSGTQAVVTANPLLAKNAGLAKHVVSLQQQLWHEKGALTALKASSLSHQAQSASQLAHLQQQLIATQHQLAAAKAAHGAAPSATGTTSVSAPSKAQLLDPASRYYGMYTEQSPFNYADMNATSTKVGVQPNLVGYFQGWDQTFRADAVQASWSHGQLPLLTWESQPSKAGNNEPTQPTYSLSAILSGSFDSYIESYAESIAATGLPLAIRLDHEMNGVWYPWSEGDGHGSSINGNSAGDYVKAWEHIWNIFQANGANQYVIWDWSPNIINNLTAAHKTVAYMRSLYPGDKYVDWVGLSGYLRPPFSADQKFTFDATYGPSLAILREITSKKIILSEIGASDVDGHKPAWITSLFAALARPQNSDIIGFAWFDEAVTTYIGGSLGTNDWRVDSRPEALAAFIAGLTNSSDRFTLTPPRS
jgi:beta-mannanase